MNILNELRIHRNDENFRAELIIGREVEDEDVFDFDKYNLTALSGEQYDPKRYKINGQVDGETAYCRFVPIPDSEGSPPDSLAVIIGDKRGEITQVTVEMKDFSITPENPEEVPKTGLEDLTKDDLIPTEDFFNDAE